MATRSLVSASLPLATFAIAAPLFAGSASAAFVTPTDWTRPSNDAAAASARTTYQEWNVFTSPGGPNDPDVAEINPNVGAGPNPSKANVYDTSGGSFVTGGGNIYSFSVATLNDADVPSYGLGATGTTDVLFQVRTLGTELDYANVRLVYNDGTTNQTVAFTERQELERVSLGGFGGTQVDTLFRFDIPYSPSTFKIEFDASGSSMSTDRVSADTLTSVPEPASFAMLAAGGLLALRRRRA